MEYGAALDYLDRHINLEATVSSTRLAPPSLDRMRELVGVMADPQHQYPVVHLTGTNGKTSTARLLTRLLDAAGLSVGTYTSPHLERVNERLAWNGQPISDDAFGEIVGAVAAFEPLLSAAPSYFEILTASAFRWFADVAIHAAVVEVGLLGRWDATNVADGKVAVVTNVGADHIDYAGSIEGVASEKAGIVKPGAVLVLGEVDPALSRFFDDTPAGEVWRRDDDFACVGNQLALGGRLLDLRTPGGVYDDVFLSLHGGFQGDNAACALAAAEAFLGRPLDHGLVAEAFADVASPGRLEIAGRDPLCILDGAHNPAGAASLAAAVGEEFDEPRRRIVVLGVLTPHDLDGMIEALAPLAIDHVVACAPPTARAIPAEEIAAAARRAGLPAEIAPSVAEAVARARSLAGRDDLVLVTGSLHTVGAARSALRSDLA